MPRPRSDIAPRIIEAARARFLTDGVNGASLRQIAHDAGTNIGMVVYYFRTKDALFLAVVDDVYRTIVEDLARLLRTDDAALDRLGRAFVRIGNASDIEMDVLRLIVREALGSPVRRRKIIRRMLDGHVRLIVDTLKDGVRRGEIDRRIPIPLLFLIVFGAGALPQVMRRAPGSVTLFASLPDPEQLATMSTELLSRLVGARSQGSPRGRAVSKR